MFVLAIEALWRRSRRTRGAILVGCGCAHFGFHVIRSSWAVGVLREKHTQENGFVLKCGEGGWAGVYLAPGICTSLRAIHEGPSSAANWVSTWQLVDHEGMQSLGEQHSRDWIKLEKVLSMTSQPTRLEFKATHSTQHVDVVFGTVHYSRAQRG